MGLGLEEGWTEAILVAFFVPEPPPHWTRSRKDRTKVGTANPTHLKRQKEQKRKEKAEEKRAAKAAKKDNPQDPQMDVTLMKPLTGPAPIQDF